MKAAIGFCGILQQTCCTTVLSSTDIVMNSMNLSQSLRSPSHTQLCSACRPPNARRYVFAPLMGYSACVSYVTHQLSEFKTECHAHCRSRPLRVSCAIAAPPAEGALLSCMQT